MQSGAVVEGLDVIEDGGTSCGVGREALMINQLVFESAPEGFDKGVVVTVAFAAHGSEQTVLSEQLSVGCAGELSSPIGVGLPNRGQCANLDILKLEESLSSMARSVRVEFPGAFYHVMARGNRHNPSSTVKEDVSRFAH